MKKHAILVKLSIYLFFLHVEFPTGLTENKKRVLTKSFFYY